MRSEINDNQLEEVVGGTVIISKDYNNIGFTTLRVKYDLIGVDARTARNKVEEWLDAHRDMTNAEFDAYCRDQLGALGWISY